MTKIQIHPKPNSSLPLKEIVAIRISIFEIVYSENKMSACQEKSESKYKYILYQIPFYHYRKLLQLEFQLPRLSTPTRRWAAARRNPNLFPARQNQICINTSPGKFREKTLGKLFWRLKTSTSSNLGGNCSGCFEKSGTDAAFQDCFLARQLVPGVHFLLDVLPSWADRGSCAHKCVC